MTGLYNYLALKHHRIIYFPKSPLGYIHSFILLMWLLSSFIFFPGMLQITWITQRYFRSLVLILLVLHSFLFIFTSRKDNADSSRSLFQSVVFRRSLANSHMKTSLALSDGSMRKVPGITFNSWFFVLWANHLAKAIVKGHERHGGAW